VWRARRSSRHANALKCVRAGTGGRGYPLARPSVRSGIANRRLASLLLAHMVIGEVAGAGAPRQWHVGNFGLPDRLHLTHFVLCRLELSPWPLPASRSQRRLCVVRPACGEPIRSVDHHRPRRSYFTAKVTQLRLAIFTQSRVSGDWSSGHHHGGVARPPGVMSARGRPAQRKPWLDVGVAVGGREGVCPADESTKRFDNRFPQRGVAIGTPTKFSTSPHPKGEIAAAPPYEGWPRRMVDPFDPRPDPELPYTVTEIRYKRSQNAPWGLAGVTKTLGADGSWGYSLCKCRPGGIAFLRRPSRGGAGRRQGQGGAGRSRGRAQASRLVQGARGPGDGRGPAGRGETGPRQRRTSSGQRRHHVTSTANTKNPLPMSRP
jgi:hypothetical protein